MTEEQCLSEISEILASQDFERRRTIVCQRAVCHTPHVRHVDFYIDYNSQDMRVTTDDANLQTDLDDTRFWDDLIALAVRYRVVARPRDYATRIRFYTKETKLVITTATLIRSMKKVIWCSWGDGTPKVTVKYARRRRVLKTAGAFEKVQRNLIAFTRTTRFKEVMQHIFNTMERRLSATEVDQFQDGYRWDTFSSPKIRIYTERDFPLDNRVNSVLTSLIKYHLAMCGNDIPDQGDISVSLRCQRLLITTTDKEGKRNPRIMDIDLFPTLSEKGGYPWEIHDLDGLGRGSSVSTPTADSYASLIREKLDQKWWACLDAILSTSVQQRPRVVSFVMDNSLKYVAEMHADGVRVVIPKDIETPITRIIAEYARLTGVWMPYTAVVTVDYVNDVISVAAKLRDGVSTGDQDVVTAPPAFTMSLREFLEPREVRWSALLLPTLPAVVIGSSEEPSPFSLNEENTLSINPIRIDSLELQEDLAPIRQDMSFKLFPIESGGIIINPLESWPKLSTAARNRLNNFLVDFYRNYGKRLGVVLPSGTYVLVVVVSKVNGVWNLRGWVERQNYWYHKV